MPFVEWRGNKCRVKWWAGEYLPNGSKKYEAKSGFTDEEAARNYGLDREYEVRHGTHIKTSDGNTPMSTYCWDWYEAQDLRPASMASYKSMLTARIIPYWGTRPVAEISAFEHDAWAKGLRALAAEGKLSHSYVKTLLMLFGMLMEDAVDKYRLRKVSPVQRARPRRGKYHKKPRMKKRPQEMATVYALARNAYTVWGFTGWTYLWTTAFTALRPGEMYGFQRAFASPNWPASDPDPERREEALERYGPEKMPALRVQYQHQRVDGVRMLTEPKYESWRTLVVPPFLHDMHTALLASHDSPFMFPALGGGCLLGVDFNRDYWKPIRDGWPERTARSDGLRPAIPAVPEMAGLTIYRNRHGHKEWLDEDGHCEVAVETRMGHEVAGLRGLYGNLTPGMELAIIDSLQKRWELFLGSQRDLWLPPIPSPLPVDHGLAA